MLQKIDETVSSDVESQVIQSIKDIHEQQMPFLTELAKKERLRMAKLSPRYVDFIDSSYRHAKSNPQFLPNYIPLEEYTKDKDYYKEMFCFLTQNKVSCDDAYLDAVFTRGKTNVHRTKDSSAENEFSSWPESHRALFTTLFTDHRETYASMGYDIEFAFC